MYFNEYFYELLINFQAILRNISSNFNITLSQSIHLLAITSEGISMSQLSYKLGLDTSTLTRNIHKLENMKLLYKSQSNYDKRVQNVLLTKEGKLLVNKINDSISEFNYKILSHIDIENQEMLNDVIEKLLWSIDCVRDI